MQNLLGWAAGRGLPVLSEEESSGLSGWQEFACALLVRIRWSNLLAVVRGNSLVRGFRNSPGKSARSDFLGRYARRNRWHGFAGLSCVQEYAGLSCWQGFAGSMAPLIDTPCHSPMNLAPLREPFTLESSRAKNETLETYNFPALSSSVSTRESRMSP